jgi:glycosyltransferase involved in cell wall biosynthesis
MRILWHSAYPGWDSEGRHPGMPTGYASQTALILPRLKALGHEVAVSATAGQTSFPGQWQGIPVFPCTPYADVGEDVVRGHYAQFKADVVFTFLCTWLLSYPAVWRDLRTVHITPVDCSPMSMADYQVIADTGGTPAAVSQFGLEMMRQGIEGRARLDPLYLPHGVDVRCFTPSPDREAIRTEMGLAGKFTVGMNFMNNDRMRKNVMPSLYAFQAFHGEHPDAVLLIHAIQALPEGIHLPRMAAHLGIPVVFSPQHELVTGQITPKMLADWYNALDVYLSPGNEGFGLPGIEAQACGTPGIFGNWSTGPEMAGPGWLVQGDRYRNDKHEADWGLADERSILAALNEAYEDARNRRDAARDFAISHDINRVVREHWEPVLAELG